MTKISKISWTEKTWNPVVGCSIVSDGCRECYAMRMTHRLQSNPITQKKYADLTRETPNGPRWTGVVRCLPERLDQPKQWKKPRLVFVNSMADLLHKDVPLSFILEVFGVMRGNPQHTFQVLTKRAERIPELDQALRYLGPAGWPDNVWMGVSCENQETADDRIAPLLLSGAKVRFVSCEPLLGVIHLDCLHYQGLTAIDALNGLHGFPIPHAPFSQSMGGNGVIPKTLDWVIVGGESGPDARPMHPLWVKSLRDQCVVAHVPFFFKQWGQWEPVEDGWRPGDTACFPDSSHQNKTKQWMRRVKKKREMPELDGKKWAEFPSIAIDKGFS